MAPSRRQELAAENESLRQQVAVLEQQLAALSASTMQPRSAGTLSMKEPERLVLDMRFEEQVIASAPVAVVVNDLDGIIRYVNRAFLDLWGLASSAEAVGKLEASFWAQPELVREIMARAPGESRFHGQLTARRPDGTTFEARVAAAVLAGEHDQPLGSVAFFTDTTEERRAEVALRLSEAQLREAQRVARIGHWSLDLETEEMHWSDLMYGVLGVPPQTKPSWDVVAAMTHPEDHRMGVARLREAIRTGQPFSHVQRIYANGGELRYIEGRVQVNRDPDGVVRYVTGTAQDVTERRRAEEELIHSRDELSLLNAELEQALRVKTEFLATMSHELRTPLTAILGLTEVLQLGSYGPLNEKQCKLLQTIDESGHHLLELINDVLDLSRIEAGQLDLQSQDFSVVDICRSSLQMISGIAQQKGQSLSFAISPAMIDMKADARRLKQILVNLLSNAVKFTPAGGELGLEVEGDAERQAVEFVVWDKGIGIPEEDLPRIFLPFVQLDSSLARQHMGTGLGLPLVQRLTELQGGGLSVESQPRRGSRFTVTLPWRASSAVPTGGSEVSYSSMLDPSLLRGLQDRIILIVDDSETTLQMLADFLQSLGWRTAAARRGAEAVERAAELHPALILMDIQMPGVDGYEAIRRVRASEDPQIAATPIIALSALAVPGDRERCLAAGACGYLTKPLDLPTTAQLIAAEIGKARSHERVSSIDPDR